MSTRKLLILTSIFLGLLAFVVLYERHEPTSEEKAKAARKFLDFKAEDVASVVLERSDLPRIELRKNAGRWTLAADPPGRADSFAADNLVSDLGRLELVGEIQTSFDPKEYGLDAPKGTVTLVFKDGSKRTVSFGKEIPGTDGTAASDGTRLGAVRFAPVATLSKPVNEFRSKRIFEGPTSDVTRITIVKGPNKVVLSREDPGGKPSGSWRIESPVADLASSSFAERLLSDLSAAQVSDFPSLSPTDLTRVGLTPPAVQVTLQKGAEILATLAFGAAKADATGKAYAMDGPLVVVADDRAQEELGKEFSAMRESRVLPVEVFRVRKVLFEAGDLRAGAEKVEGDWRSGGRVVPASAVEELVGRLSRAESRGFVARKDFAARGVTAGQKGAKPIATIEVLEEKAEAAQVAKIWTASEAGGPALVAAEVTGRSDALLVEAAVLDDLRRDATALRDAALAAATPPATTPVAAPAPKALAPASPAAPAAPAPPMKK